MVPDPEPFEGSNNLPYHIESLKDSLGNTEKYIHVTFPKKVMISALKVETLREKYLQSFQLSYSPLDFVEKGELKPIVVDSDMNPMVTKNEVLPLVVIAFECLLFDP